MGVDRAKDKKRVLLTGASGFIGRHCIAPLLARGYEVHALSTQPRNESGKGLTWHQIDLLQHDAVRSLLRAIEPSHLLHLAWYVVPGRLISAPENFAWVASSMELVSAFAEWGGRRIVVAGSAYEYDWRYGYCSEALTPADPSTVYGACKRALQLLVKAHASEGGMSWAWGRVFFLYGPHEHPQRLVSSVILSLLKNETAKCSHGRQIRDYLHVQDVANGLVALLDSPVGGAVNVSSGQATTLREIVLTIGRLMGRTELIALGALPARANDTALVVGDNTRIQTEVDWRQQRDLEQGLQDTIDWWKARNRDGS